LDFIYYVSRSLTRRSQIVAHAPTDSILESRVSVPRAEDSTLLDSIASASLLTTLESSQPPAYTTATTTLVPTASPASSSVHSMTDSSTIEDKFNVPAE
jgi:hypothetical protein